MPHSLNGAKQVSVLTENLFRYEGSRLVATLTSYLGVHHLQLAEDVVQEALVRAMQTWPYRGVPDNPAAWLTQTAKHLALDVLRREQNWQAKQDLIATEHERWLAKPNAEEPHETFSDSTLRLLFVCTHPQLSAEAQTALALRTLCGLSPAEIATAFFTSEAAIAKRLVRARQRIRELALPFVVPEPHELPARLDSVLGTLYLLFNEGYKATSGDQLVRQDLCHEAIRLTTLLTEHPATSAPRTHALLALMMLSAARLPARSDDAGNLLRLHEQDRTAWDRSLIQQGIQHLSRATAGEVISEYHLEAAIAACHSTAANDAATDWTRILFLYDQLLALRNSPIAAMNRAVAVARVHGPQAGLAALEAIKGRSSIESYYLLHAVRGALAAELGNFTAALTHFRMAGSLATLPAEQNFIARQVSQYSSPESLL